MSYVLSGSSFVRDFHYYPFNRSLNIEVNNIPFKHYDRKCTSIEFGRCALSEFIFIFKSVSNPG